MKNRILTVVALTSAFALMACGPSNNDSSSTNNTNNTTSNNGTDNNTSGTNNTSNNTSGMNNTTSNNTNNTSGTNNATNNPPMVTERAVAITADFATGASAWHAVTFAPDGSGELTVNDFGSGDVGLSVGASAVYVIDRNASQIQVLTRPDLSDGGVIDVAGEMSTNPQFTAEANGKVYIPLYNSAEVAVASPNGGQWEVARIDLSSFDAFDSNPEASAVASDEGFVLVVLQRLQDFMPVDASQLLVIDSSDDSFVDQGGSNALDLGALNAQAGLRPLPNGNFGVGATGAFGTMDGGVLEVERSAAGDYTAGEFIVEESDLGGDLLDFVFASDNAGFAIIMLADFSTQLVRFEISANSVEVIDVNTVGEPSLNGLDVSDSGEWLVAGDTAEGAVGFGLFGIGDFAAAQTLPTTLPPADIEFLD